MTHKPFSFDRLDLELSTIQKTRGESLPPVVARRAVPRPCTSQPWFDVRNTPPQKQQRNPGEELFLPAVLR